MRHTKFAFISSLMLGTFCILPTPTHAVDSHSDFVRGLRSLGRQEVAERKAENQARQDAFNAANPHLRQRVDQLYANVFGHNVDIDSLTKQAEELGERQLNIKTPYSPTSTLGAVGDFAKGTAAASVNVLAGGLHLLGDVETSQALDDVVSGIQSTYSPQHKALLQSYQEKKAIFDEAMQRQKDIMSAWKYTEKTKSYGR